MGFIKEFKEFAVKGNVIDLAVGVIIGAAFGKIVDSVVNDLIMPLVAVIIGKPDFSNLYIVLKGSVPQGTALADARKIPATAIFAYGNFITVLINFILLALIIFMMVKGVNRLRRKQLVTPPAVPPAPTPTEVLLAEIRDELRRTP